MKFSHQQNNVNYSANQNSQNSKILFSDASNNKQICECNECKTIKKSIQQQSNLAYCPSKFSNCTKKSPNPEVNKKNMPSNTLLSTEAKSIITPIRPENHPIMMYDKSFYEANKGEAHSLVSGNNASNHIDYRPQSNIDSTSSINKTKYWNNVPIMKTGNHQHNLAFKYNYKNYYFSPPTSNSETVPQQEQTWTNIPENNKLNKQEVQALKQVRKILLKSVKCTVFNYKIKMLKILIFSRTLVVSVNDLVLS